LNLEKGMEETIWINRDVGGGTNGKNLRENAKQRINNEIKTGREERTSFCIIKDG
jgi:hypothetical protein